MQESRSLASSFRFKAAGIIIFLLFNLALFGCKQKNTLETARNLVKQYEADYRGAESAYKALIRQGKDLDQLYFELGQLYFSHSEFALAKEEFKKVKSPGARKFLAVSYYHLGDFTEALQIFGELSQPDDQALYYYGLTCEKLNLFDKALESYKKIKAQNYLALAAARLAVIEKQDGHRHIREISPEAERIIANAPDPKDYPQAGAQILLCDEKVEVAPENKEFSYLHYLVRILNERGKESFAETAIEYDSTYEKVELEYARTIRPDGLVVEVGTRHIRDVTKYLNFPLYSNARVYIISFPEIAEGSCIEYKLKIVRNQLVNKKDFVLAYPVQSSDPIIAANFSIDLPKEKVLHSKIFNQQYNNFSADLKPKIEKNQERTIYRWQFKNIPQIIPEANMPPSAEINPLILFSTFNKWEEVYQWWWELAKNKIRADAAIQAKIAQLIRPDDPLEAKARKIYNFCAQEIRYVAVEYGQAGYEPHQAADIFRNKYGDCKDQAILLVTMLREAGLSSWPVLIGTKDAHDLNTDFPTVLFNHCIACVVLRGEIIFLDPTAETCSFGDLPAGDQDRQVLLCKDDGYKIEKTPFYPASHNLARQVMEIKINPDESIAAEKSIFSLGLYDQAQRYWLLYTLPELVRDQLESKIQSISIGAKLENYQTKNVQLLDKPVELSYKFKGPEFFTLGGKLRIVPALTGFATDLVAKDKRRYPIDLEVLDIKETELKIELPPNFVIKYIPQDVVVESPWLRFIARYKYDGHKLFFSEKSELKQNKISQKEYAEFKQFMEDLAIKTKQRIVLERIR